MPNTLAYLMLMLWPIVVLVLFAQMRAERAFVWSIVGGYLLLPQVAAFRVPFFPDLDRTTVPALSVLAVAVLIKGHRIALLPQSWLARVLVVGFVLTPLATALTNPDPIVHAGQPQSWASSFFAGRVLPGLTPYDGLAMMVANAFALVTFTLARHFLATPAAMRDLLVALGVAALAYSLPMLLEVRLSPQLNIWIYGFFQHSFEQMMRGGGFRPIVFLEHGLWVALFALTGLFSAVGLARFEPEARMRWVAAAVYLAGVLVLCKTLGVVIYALLFVPVLLACRPATILSLCALVAAVVFVYPLLRASGLVPAEQIVEFFRSFNPLRAQSLEFRLEHEKMLLDHAIERVWFGWGAFERNLLIDPATGRAMSVSDGRWVIVFGILGAAGYVMEFGLLVAPLLLLARDRAGVAPAAVVLALIHAVNLVDLLPNATLTQITWIVGGALLAHAERQRAAEVAPAPNAVTRPARQRTVL
ncbi:MAG: hypothetical protein ACK4TB_08915 [Gemmobacter sp.]